MGSRFVPCDSEDPKRSVTIMFHPERSWVNRYYSGTDPIVTDDGHSNMSTAIWDNYYRTAAAVVNFRDTDHKKTFLQSFLLNLYYKVNQDGKEGMPKELVETNIGAAYTDYQENKGYCLVECEAGSNNSTDCGVNNAGCCGTTINCPVK